jgi:CRP/FNR family transcriptional regulator, cyclic AMP receptor protein
MPTTNELNPAKTSAWRMHNVATPRHPTSINLEGCGREVRREVLDSDMVPTFSREDWALLRPVAATRRVLAKHVIFYKGDASEHVYLIERGQVKVSAPSEDGKELTFAVLSPGDMFGEIGVVQRKERSATVTAVTPTELSVIAQKDFLAVLNRHGDLCFKMLNLVCERVRRTSEIAEDLSFLSLPSRLAKKLNELAATYGVRTDLGVKLNIYLCQQELANMVGTSRESINKQLSVWQMDGAVIQDHGYLTLTGHPRLEHTVLSAFGSQQISAGYACRGGRL